MHKRKYILIFLIVGGAWVLFMMFPKALSYGASEGLSFCCSILIPSLFPFMFLSSFTVQSGISAKLGKLLKPITKTFFHLSGASATGIIISCIGGYPTGARTIKSLYDESLISKDEAEHMMMFCVCAGPGFIINAVGVGMLNSFNLGVILFVSQVVSFFSLAIISGIIFRRKATVNTEVQHCSKDFTHSINASQALIKSLSDTIFSMVMMCGFVVFFSALISVLTSAGVINFVGSILADWGINKAISYSLIPCFLEITGGCNIATKLNAPIEFISFALGFSGLCVHCQLFAIFNTTRKLKFMLFRIIASVFSAINTHAILELFPQSKDVVLPSYGEISVNRISSSNSIFSTITLLFMSLIFIVSLAKTTKKM